MGANWGNCFCDYRFGNEPLYLQSQFSYEPFGWKEPVGSAYCNRTFYHCGDIIYRESLYEEETEQNLNIKSVVLLII
jgi:hypothetical protein